jgi:hypothetical protein
MQKKVTTRAAIFFFSFFICAIPFIKVLFFEDRALLYRDISRHFLPGKVYWARSFLDDGSIPLWNYSSFGGMPFWAENVNSPLHPFNFLFLLFPLDRAANVMSWFIYLHYPLILLGAYYLLRALNLKQKEAILMAFALAVSGTLMSAHNLCHSLFSFVAIPWFLSFWIRFLKKGNSINLFAAAFSLSWPIYAGDPQFTYFLIFAALYVGWKLLPFKTLMYQMANLGILAILASAAQLFPLIEMISHSNRGLLDGLSRSELLYFSFHPIRFLESIFPQVFGNHIGDFSFWGQKYINFPFPSPFLFSTFPGSVVFTFGVFGILHAAQNWKEGMNIHLLIIFSALVLLCLGAYSPIPIYEFLLDWLPLFGSFRYPERMLFFLNFVFWLLACKFILSENSTSHENNAKLKIFWCLFLLLYVTAALLLYFLDWAPKINVTTLWGLFFTLTTILLSYFFLFKKFRNPMIYAFFLIQLLEAFIVQEKLSWDSSIYITDKNRYPIIQEILTDLKKREVELSKGAARRYSSLEIAPRTVAQGALSHTNFSSFAAYEVATPNISSFYGFDDTSGYFALAPKKFESLLLNVAGRSFDERMIKQFYILTGTYYRSYRGNDQHVIVEKIESALPYLSMPKSLKGVEQKQELENQLRDIDLTKRALILGGTEIIEQPEGASFSNFQRTGSDMQVMVASKNPNPWVIWNESNHDSWRPYINSVPIEKKEANGFAMAMKLPKNLSDFKDGVYYWKLQSKFESSWIRLGVLFTSIFFFIFLATGIRQLRNPEIEAVG